MSWRKQESFKVNTSTSSHKNTIRDRPYLQDNQKSFQQLETEILKADIIESSLLMMNSKDMMITTERVNIHTVNNSLQIPSNGPVNINENVIVEKDDVHIRGSLHVNKKLKNSINMYLVNRILLQPRIVLDANMYNTCNHFMIDCPVLKAKGEIYMMPFQNYSAEWSPQDYEHLYVINFCVNAHKDSLVDIDIVLDNQNTIIKMQSRYSSLSLLWVPEGKWLIQSLGYKTIIIDV